MHTIRCEGADILLLDHDLERELAFEALREGEPEGCLAVRDAWTGVAIREAPRDFLQAMLDEDHDIHQHMVEELKVRVAFAPLIQKALVEARQGDPEPHTPIGLLSRRQLVLLGLPRALALAYCRQLQPGLSQLDDQELRRRLIGEPRSADVLPFMRRP